MCVAKGTAQPDDGEYAFSPPPLMKKWIPWETDKTNCLGGRKQKRKFRCILCGSQRSELKIKILTK